MDLLLLFLDHRRGRFAVDIAAGLLALDHNCVVASDGAHTDRRAAAAANRPGALTNRRAARAARFAAHHRPGAPFRATGCGAAAFRTAARCSAAFTIAGSSLLASARAGARLCARTRLRTGLLCLRELEAIRGRIGRSGGSQTDRHCGSDNKSKYSHLFLLWSIITPRETTHEGDTGFRAIRCFSMYGRSRWSHGLLRSLRKNIALTAGPRERGRFSRASALPCKKKPGRCAGLLKSEIDA